MKSPVSITTGAKLSAHTSSGSKARRWLRRFRKDEDGNSTIEFIIWFPLMVTMLVFSVETSVAIFNMNQAWDVARDATRKVAVGEMTMSEAEQMVSSTLPAKLQPVVSVSETGSRDITMNLTITPQTGSFGAISKLTLGDIEISYVMRKETDSNTGGS